MYVKNSKEIVLGVDPGISNTGATILEHESGKYKVLTSRTLCTDKKLERGHRLFLFSNEIESLICDYGVTMVSVERVFFSKNVSSAMDTEAVISIVEVEAYKAKVPCLLFTPQVVKAATGLGGAANKRQVKSMMQKLTSWKFRTHHQSDASAVALAGILQGRSAETQTQTQEFGYNHNHRTALSFIR